MIGFVTNPMALWLGAALCLVLALRARRAGGRKDSSTLGAPGVLAFAGALPLPAGLVRLGQRPGTADLVQGAGLRGIVSVELVERARVGGALVGVAIGAALATIAPVGVLFVPLLAGLGFQLPGRVLAARAARRRARLVRQLPDLLDLLVISVEAGMALDPALSLAAERLPGALSDEVGSTLRELRLGTPRRAAYQGLAERAGSAELKQVVGALLQAEELGAPLSRALAGQAESMRTARRQRARDRAARAAPRIQLVVALLMVPAALFLVMGVLLLELARQVGAVL